MDKDYKGVVWTDHSLEKMRERGINQGDAWATFRRPDSNRKAKTRGAFIYYKTFGKQRIEVVAKKDPSAGSGRNGKWIILSVWSKENKKSKKNSSILRKFTRFLKGGDDR